MDLFQLSKDQYKALHKADKLRAYIRDTTPKLGIVPEHDSTGHWYSFKGQRYPSVTTRLQLLKDKSLDNWKMNRALDYIFQNFHSFTDANIMEHLQKAQDTPRNEFLNAGDIGTQVHKWREEWFSRLIAGDDFPPVLPSSVPEVVSGCRAILKFMHETHYIPVASELYLASEALQTAGTGDDIGLLDGKLTFLDLKTSNSGDKNAYFYQVALYTHMFETLYGLRVNSAKILHVSKKHGTYDLIDIPDIRKRIREAKHIVKVDLFLGKLKEEKKVKSIIV